MLFSLHLHHLEKLLTYEAFDFNRSFAADSCRIEH